MAVCKNKTTVSRKAPARRNSARKSSARRPPARKTRKTSPRRWSGRVTKESDALDLKRGVFKLTSASKIAASLKRSAEHSSRRKSFVYLTSLSMLTFYINRAGKNIPNTKRERLEFVKCEMK